MKMNYLAVDIFDQILIVRYLALLPFSVQVAGLMAFACPRYPMLLDGISASALCYFIECEQTLAIMAYSRI